MKKLFGLFLITSFFFPSLTLASDCIITIRCENFSSTCSASYSNCEQKIGYEKTAYSIEDYNLYNQLKGKIIMLVESQGEAYYVNPDNNLVYYLGHSTNALKVMQSFAKGISNQNLNKIKTGVLNQYGNDTDRDGLSDSLEIALGTNQNSFNSDGDRYSDKEEITNGYNANGAGKLPISTAFTNKMKGKILLQAESLGQTWYVNPSDGKKYMFSSQYEIGDIIKQLAIGISNSNFNKLIR